MISWKGPAGFLYQTIEAGERARQRRDRKRERESERDRALLEERASIGNKIKP